MLDQLDARIWAAHHDDFTASVKAASARIGAVLQGALTAIDLAFCKLARIRFGAPWQPRKHSC